MFLEWASYSEEWLLSLDADKEERSVNQKLLKSEEQVILQKVLLKKKEGDKNSVLRFGGWHKGDG